MYYVEDVHDISWNDRAIASLVLPRDYKSLILAFVESQASQKQDFDDVIAGKGEITKSSSFVRFISSSEPILDRTRSHHAPCRAAWNRKDAHCRIR